MTSLVAVLVAIVPGALLGFALPPGRFRWAAWASAPALTLGLISVTMGWLPKLGLPHSAGAVLLAELLLAGAVVLIAQLVSRRKLSKEGAGQGPASPVGLPVHPQRADIIGLAVPAVITMSYGWLLLGRLIAPPGWDAMNHGFFTRRILDTASATIPAACTSGVTEPVISCSFYPLATNVAWAQAAQLSGGQISAVMTAWSIFVGPLALVAGIYACVRVLNGNPIVAACAAAAPTFLGPTWLSVVTGRVTQQTGPAIAAGIALLIVLALRSPHPVRLGLLAGLASGGLVMTHTYDALVVVLLVLGLLLAVRIPSTWRGSMAGAGAALVAGLAAIGPFLGVLLGANGERLANEPALLNQFDKAFEYWVTDPQRYVLLGFPAPGGRDFQLDVLTIQIGLVLTIACLLASPLCLVLPQLRWARPWLLTGVVFTAIGVWTTSSDSSVAMLLSGLWYGVRERLRSMIFPVYGVLAVAGAVVIGLGVQWLMVRLIKRAQALRESALPTKVAALALIISLALLAAVPDTWRPIRKEFKNRGPASLSYVRTYEWLAEHTPPGKVVAYDRHRQFMTWSYVDYEVPLLFGIPPLPTLDNTDYAQRWAAWNWLVNNEDAAPAGCEVRRFGVEYVVVGGRGMPGVWDKNYDDQRLTMSDRITLVHKIGKIEIYQVTEKGRDCATSF